MKFANVVAGILGIGITVALAWPAQADDDVVVVAGWGGSYQAAQRQAFFDPFTKATGIKVVEQSADYGKLKVQVESGNVEWDVVDVEDDFRLRAAKTNLLEQIDYAAIGRAKSDFLDGLANDYGVPGIAWSTVLAYDTRKVPASGGPKSWKDFWDVKAFPGARTVQKNPVNILEAALLADGVPADKLYPLDVDRAFRSLDRIKPYITVWYDAPTKAEQLLVDGEVAFSVEGNARFQKLKRQGLPVGINWGGALQTSEDWVIPRGAPHKAAALKFLAFVSTPERQAALAQLVDYGPTNKAAFKFLDPKQELPSSPDLQPQEVAIDHGYWAEHFDAINERFNEWLLK